MEDACLFVSSTRHTAIDEAILPWNGRVVCRPSDRRRMIVERGVATINAWKEPSYRRLGVADAQYGVAGEFFDWFFTRAAERDVSELVGVVATERRG